MTKVAVVGAAGFIGRELTRQLNMSGCQTVPISRADCDLVASSCVPKLQTMLASCSVIYILAALTPKRGLSPHESNLRFMDNLRIAENVFTAISTSDAQTIVYVSSDAVYSADSDNLSEDLKTDPACMYGLAHKVRERMLLELLHNRRVLILRPCALYGFNDPHNGYGPNRFMRDAVSKRSITLFGRGEELRNHMFVGDFVRFMMTLVAGNAAGIFNIADEQAISFYDLAILIKNRLPFKVEINFVERMIPIQHKTHNISKVQSVIQNIMCVPLESGIDLMYNYLVSQKEVSQEL